MIFFLIVYSKEQQKKYIIALKSNGRCRWKQWRINARTQIQLILTFIHRLLFSIVLQLYDFNKFSSFSCCSTIKL